MSSHLGQGAVLPLPSSLLLLSLRRRWRVNSYAFKSLCLLDCLLCRVCGLQHAPLNEELQVRHYYKRIPVSKLDITIKITKRDFKITKNYKIVVGLMKHHITSRQKKKNNNKVYSSIVLCKNFAKLFLVWKGGISN